MKSDGISESPVALRAHDEGGRAETPSANLLSLIEWGRGREARICRLADQPSNQNVKPFNFGDFAHQHPLWARLQRVRNAPTCGRQSKLKRYGVKSINCPTLDRFSLIDPSSLVSGMCQ
jgi:hypothetical protein